MHIVCSTDNNYIMPTGVMMCSLLENNKDEIIVFHVLGSDLSEKSKGSLRRIVEKYGKEIHFYTVNEDDFKDFPINQKGQSGHIHSLATYYRLLMGNILPQSVKKVIYLDGDIIVRHSLRELWNTNIDDVAIGGAPDVCYSSMVHYNRLKYSPSLGYFNAGVLLINLEYWRRNDVIKTFFDIVQRMAKQLASHDQDILNYAFRNNKIHLPIKYNLQNVFLYQPKYFSLTWELEAELQEAIKDPVIIHYIYIDKPWYKECHHPYKGEFFKYRALTQWKNLPLKRLHSRWWYLKRILREIGGKIKFHLTEGYQKNLDLKD